MYLSRLCEAFGALPSVVMAERARLPDGLLEEIVEARAFERAYQVYEANPKARGGLVDDVKVLEFERAQEEIDHGGPVQH